MTVHLEVLVEELSAERALATLLPRIIGQQATFAIRVFQGKRDLLAKLPTETFTSIASTQPRKRVPSTTQAEVR